MFGGNWAADQTNTFVNAALLHSRRAARDFGTHSLEKCDYPDLIYPAAAAVGGGPFDTKHPMYRKLFTALRNHINEAGTVPWQGPLTEATR